MAARNSRGRRRRGRFGFLYKVLCVLLILAAIVGGCIVFFRVENIEITGSTVYSDEEIIAAAGIELGDNLMLVNWVQSGRKIVNQLPYISEVNPRPSLPDTLILNVTECTPVGILKGEEGTWWVMDSKCRLLEEGGNELTQKYPKITGLTALVPSVGKSLAVSVEESTKLDSLKQILNALEGRNMLGNVQSINMSGGSEIHLSYEERFDVRLPMYSDDFAHLIYILEQASAKLDAGQTGTIDLILLPGEQGRFIPD